MTGTSVRTIRDDERAEAARVVNYGMLGSLADEVNEAWADLIDADRALGAYAATGELVGLTRNFGTEVTVPGGEVPAAGVTAVAVLSTHRRQGHLTRLMRAQLERLASESVPVALLVAAEWPIYGRFGYGPAVDACRLEIDAPTARFRAPATGSIEMVPAAVLRPELEAAHEARRARTPGAVRRDPEVWDRIAGVVTWPGQPAETGKQRGALWRDADGVVQGAVAYRVDEAWDRNRPAGRADVRLLVGATPEAERGLWRHVCEIDWVRTVSAADRSIDDPLPLLLDDGRAVAALDHFDCIWARLLDVPAALGARRSQQPAQVVVEVADEFGLAGGRWHLDLAPDGAEVTSTSAPADVALPVGALGALYFGGHSARRLHDAGWIDEACAGGIARLDAALGTAVAPWSPTTY